MGRYGVQEPCMRAVNNLEKAGGAIMHMYWIGRGERILINCDSPR